MIIIHLLQIHVLYTYQGIGRELLECMVLFIAVWVHLWRRSLGSDDSEVKEPQASNGAARGVPGVRAKAVIAGRIHVDLCQRR